MKKKTWLSGALVLALLTGCAGMVNPIAPADPDDMAYLTADVRRTDPLITVDGVGINAEEYLFWLVNAVAEQQYYGAISGDEGWDALQADGTTTAQAIKADARQAAVLYQVVRNKAQELGVTLTAEQTEELSDSLAEAKEQVGGQEAYQSWLEANCISEEGFATLNQVGYLSQGIREKLAEAGELAVTEADVAGFVESEGIYAAKHILIATRHMNDDGSYEDFTPEEKEEAFAQVQDLREQLRKAGDDETLFDQLMNEHSQDGRDGEGNLYAPQGYDFVYAGQMVPEFENGALALEVGQISEPIETDYGYHIILRMEPNMDTVRSYCDEDYKLNTLMQQWLDEAQVTTTKAYDELDPHDFYTRLQSVAQARREARESQQPQESAAPQDFAQPEEGGEAQTSPEPKG